MHHSPANRAYSFVHHPATCDSSAGVPLLARTANDTAVRERRKHPVERGGILLKEQRLHAVVQ
jgi:hypothetical protein